jgi:hypothetical protein
MNRENWVPTVRAVTEVEAAYDGLAMSQIGDANAMPTFGLTELNKSRIFFL